MYKATAGNTTFEIVFNEEGKMIVDGKPFDWDLLNISPNEFHALFQHKGYRIEVIHLDSKTREATLKVNNKIIRVSVKNKFDLLLEKMGMDATAGSQANAVKAPMPGLVVEVRVKPGDQISAGDPLIILEAMKMENIIRSAGDGIVQQVHVTTGQGVEKNQVLVEF